MRITIDLDKKSDLRKTLIKINSYFNKPMVDEIWLSSSKRGYHLIISHLNITFETSLFLRRIFNDDIKRIYIDTLRDKVGHATQVLFTSKGHKKSKLLYSKAKKINKLPICYQKYVL